jgi:hypothetical protein
MSSPVRFWGTVVAVRPRLTLAIFEDERTPKCGGHLLLLEGTRTVAGGRPEAGRFVVALGPATQERRAVAAGDLLRGDAHPVPEGNDDTPADLYRVGAFHVLARAADNAAAAAVLPDDPPRADPPLTPAQAEAAPRRSLAPDNLLAEGGPCAPCPYGTVVAVVRLTDPRDWRSGRWARVPACLGPRDCPHYAPAPSAPAS